MSASRTTIKQLFGFSYNECAHPDCPQALIEIDKLSGKSANYAKIAHIHGQKPGAERFLQKVYDDELLLHGFDNLLLLCGKHHDQIDQPGAEEFYTADLVREWKSNHMLKAAAEVDREWVFGGQTINFGHEGQNVSLSYWITNTGELRFHSQEQLVQTSAAFDMSYLFRQLGTLFSLFEQITGEPDDPSNQSVNDSYIRELKKQAEGMKRGISGSGPRDGYESALHRIYENLNKCPDITLEELAEVGTEKQAMKTTLIVGEVTPERIAEAIESAKKDAK
ncbi:MAG: hypothetical protein V3U96_01815 [Paracoccaceae bacterium]